MSSSLHDIVTSSWRMVQDFSSIKKLNFFPSLISTLWLFILLTYQATYVYMYFFHASDQVVHVIENFSQSTYFYQTVGLLILTFLGYMLLSPMAEGALLEMIRSYRSTDGKDPYHSFQGFILGLRHFLGLFELHNLLTVFKPLSIITFTLFIMRGTHGEYLPIILAVMTGYMFLALIVNTLFAYARFFIVFQGKGAIEAISASTTLALDNITITIRLYFTLLLVYLRTIITALIFLIIPFFVGMMLAIISATILKVAFIAVMVILTCIFLVFVTHLNSVLEIFVEGMWYEAYTQNTGDTKDAKEKASSGKSSSNGTTHTMSLAPEVA